MRKIAIIAAIALFATSAEAVPKKTVQRPMLVCVNQSGLVTARIKCLKGEAPLNLAALTSGAAAPAGPQGPPGPPGALSLSSCYPLEFQFTTSSLITFDARCREPGTEFVLTHGISVYPAVEGKGVSPLIQRQALTFDGKGIPIGVNFALNQSGLLGNTMDVRFQLVCCPR